jgi:hypothetical protein
MRAEYLAFASQYIMVHRIVAWVPTFSSWHWGFVIYYAFIVAT